jgi:hypothetical protein
MCFDPFDLKRPSKFFKAFGNDGEEINVKWHAATGASTTSKSIDAANGGSTIRVPLEGTSVPRASCPRVWKEM